MYLAGSTIQVRLPNGTIQTFSSVTAELDIALRTPGSVATNVYMEEFAGGWLANGCPLNVYFGSGWLPGQQDALRAAGKTACLPSASGSSPTINAILAPDYQPGGFTATGQRIIPGSGIQNPSAPIIIQTPSGPVSDFGEGLQTPVTEIQPESGSDSSWGMLALAGLALGVLLMGRKGKG